MKQCLFVSTEYTNVTDTQTDGRKTDGRTSHDGIGRACKASRGKNGKTQDIVTVGDQQ